jgi:hypothetical protein
MAHSVHYWKREKKGRRKGSKKDVKKGTVNDPIVSLLIYTPLLIQWAETANEKSPIVDIGKCQ